MQLIRNAAELNAALSHGKRVFCLTGPRGGGKMANLIDMVGQAFGETTIPSSRSDDGRVVSLSEQLRTGAATAGTSANYGVVLVNVKKEHFPQNVQDAWDDPVAVKLAFEALVRDTRNAVRRYEIRENTAVVFNLDDAPFSVQDVRFYALNAAREF